MKMNVFITPLEVAIICTFMLAACSGQDRGGVPFGEGVTLVGDVLSKAHVSGSLEYWGVCDFKEGVPDFPKLRAMAGREVSALESLQQMFSVDPEMRVTQDRDGRIRMVEEDVPSDLLDLRIHHFRFPDGNHGPNMAKIAILKTPEVIAFRREHNIGPEYDWGPGFGMPSDGGAVLKPGVSGELYDVTVAQALDYVVETFPGFWLYENCQNPAPGRGRTVYIAFFENVWSPAPVQTRK
jgi:hypothetical protein